MTIFDSTPENWAIFAKECHRYMTTVSAYERDGDLDIFELAELKERFKFAMETAFFYDYPTCDLVKNVTHRMNRLVERKKNADL